MPNIKEVRSTLRRRHALSSIIRAESAEALVQSAEAINFPANAEVTLQVIKGLCALMWARPTPVLDLTNCKLAPECVTALALALRSNVTSLLLSNSDFAKGGNDLTGVRQLCSALRDDKRSSSLEVLVLAHNKLQSDAIVLLCEALAHNRGLRKLELGFNSIALRLSSEQAAFGLAGANSTCLKGVVALCNLLKINQRLSSINLVNNRVGADGAAHISEALKTNRSVTSLNLAGNLLRPEGIKCISEALMENESLTELNLSMNELMVSGMGHITQALKTNWALMDLDICRNDIGYSGAEFIAGALKENTGLMALNLGNNAVGRRGAESIAGALKKNTSITALNLSRNGLDAASHELLKEAAANVTIISTVVAKGEQSSSNFSKELAKVALTTTAITAGVLVGALAGALPSKPPARYARLETWMKE